MPLVQQCDWRPLLEEPDAGVLSSTCCFSPFHSTCFNLFLKQSSEESTIDNLAVSKAMSLLFSLENAVGTLADFLSRPVFFYVINHMIRIGCRCHLKN